MSTTDPYAAIRKLKFTPSYIVQANLGGGNRINETFTDKAAADARIAALGGAGRLSTSYMPDDSVLRAGGYQTKYGSNAVDQGDGTFLVNLQQPGAHKFNTMDAVFKIDPATGEAELVNDPMQAPTRQTSSARQTMTAIGTGAAFLAGGAALANSAGLGAVGTGATTGAEGLTLASSTGTYGGAGSLGNASLLTGGGIGSAGTVAAPTFGSVAAGGYGGVAGGLVAGANTAAAAGTLASATPAAGGSAAPTAPAASGSPGSGAWNGTDFTGTAAKAGSSNLGGSAMSGFGDWIQLGGLVNSIVNKPKPADTSGLTAAAMANAGIAERQQGLAEKTYADSQALFNEFKPFLVEQMKTSASEQQKSIGRSDDQWNSYLTTYRPIEQQMAQKSLNWASDSRMKSEAERAGSEVTGEFDRARTTTTRNLSMAGASPEKIAALEAASRLQEAQAVGGAQGNARRAVEKEGMAYLDNVARFGRGMPSTGLAAATVAGSQGGQATGGYRTLADASAQPAESANPLFQSAVSTNTSAGTLFGRAANTQAQGNLQDYNMTMGTLAGLNQWAQGSNYFTSSEKTKNREGRLSLSDAVHAVEKSPAEKWSYKKGQGDNRTHQRVGPMAESLRDATGGVVSDGSTVDAISLMGLHHAAIGGLAKEIRKINSRLKQG